MFPTMPGLESFSPGPLALGEPTGPMDGGSPAPGNTSQNNPRIRAGYTFLGQFIDHDLTLDVTSTLERQIDVSATHNFRTPVLELDSVYGLGPSVQPYLFDTDGVRFLLPDGETDLQRNANGRALIGDPRNDENLIISQLHLLFLKFHNKVTETAEINALTGLEKFLATQTLVRRHYQWIVLHEFLPRIVGAETVARVIAERPFLFPSDAFMPVEFSIAAYRFGHSQTRPGYALNATAGGLLFPKDPADGDLRGFRPIAPARAVDWTFFFGPHDPNPGGRQDSKFIDTRLSTAMLHLPNGVVPASTPLNQRSLATRNLQRGLDARLPSGQDVAAKLLSPEVRLAEADIWTGVAGGEGPAPLWYYILKEAEVMGQGLQLAGVGAEIVARTFVAILLADPASFLNREPDWTPTLGKTEGQFTVTDLVSFTEGRDVPGERVADLPSPSGPVEAIGIIAGDTPPEVPGAG
ncbi:MAG: peroxidase [Rhizobiaceae bacterium]|nr:peroxidase [Rhizobiaceae bacterium]